MAGDAAVYDPAILVSSHLAATPRQPETGSPGMAPRFPADENPPSWLDRNFSRLLLAIAVAGLIPRLVFGNSQFISFDGWWHLFTATQDRWLMLLREWRWEAHPPLFYLLLRFVAGFGHSHLIIRSIGIVCGSVAGVIIGVVAAKVYRYKASALLTSAAYTFAWSNIEMNCDVRAYPMALLFVLLAFDACLDWTADPAGARAGRAIVRFGAYSSLAILSEYFVVFFLAGCLGILVLRVLLRPAFRVAFLNSIRRDWKAWVFSSASISVLFLALFVFQMSIVKPQDQYYLQPYIWHDDSLWGADVFLLSNLVKEIGYFTPFNIGPGLMLALAGLLFVPALIYFAFVRRERWRGLLSADSPLLLAGLLAQLVVLALAGEYPFGGPFRHQSIIAPFVFLTAFLLLDRLADALKAFLARNALFTTAGLLVTASFAFGWAVYPWSSVQPKSAEYSRFRELFPRPENIYVGHIAAICYYAETHTSKWTFQDRFLIDNQQIIFYRVNDGNGHPVGILRNKAQTWLDLLDPETYRILAETLRHEGLESAVLFSVDRGWDTAGAKSLEEQSRTLAQLAGLEGGRYAVGPTYAFVEFRLRDEAVIPR